MIADGHMCGGEKQSPNILLTKNYDAKVADVGLACHLVSKSHMEAVDHARGTWYVSSSVGLHCF